MDGVRDECGRYLQLYLALLPEAHTKQRRGLSVGAERRNTYTEPYTQRGWWLPILLCVAVPLPLSFYCGYLEVATEDLVRST